MIFFWARKFKLFSISGQKVLLVGGDPWHLGRHVEIIDMKNMSYTCELPAKYPIDMSFGVGAVLDGNIPVICGGENFTTSIKECFKLVDQKWYQMESLPEPGMFMSTGNVVIDGKLWISGGLNTLEYGMSTEFDRAIAYDTTVLVSTNSIVKSFELPYPMIGQCSVYLDEERIMVIEGTVEAVNTQ